METKVCRLYGQENLKIETDVVRQPGPGEALVKVGRGGICGSDLHYYLHGGFGTVRVIEPIIMGHEFAGTIAAVGDGVKNVKVGDKVGVNPSQPCGQCSFCHDGLFQHCLEMRFIGSAMRLPHEQGGFREYLTIDAEQCIKGSDDTTIGELACAEPLAVCLHAAKRVALKGKKVLVSGAGPIGALCVAAAKYYGAAEIVVVDLFEKTLSVAKEIGADKVINLSVAAEDLAGYRANKGYFDIIFECSAAQPAIENVFHAIRPQGTIVQVGVTGNMTFPMNMLVGKEVNWVGSQRFHPEYAEAVELISSKQIDVKPIITDVFPMTAILDAINSATDRSKSVKVQIDFD